MSNPFNPINWITSAQDWLVKIEKSSGFRPFLIYMMLALGIGLVLFFTSPLFGSHDRHMLQYIGAICIIIPITVFPLVYIAKAFTQPDFCRSEIHIERKMKYEMEAFGTESKQITAENFDKLPYSANMNEPRTIEHDGQDEDEK